MARSRLNRDRLGVADVSDLRDDYVMARRSGAQTRARRGVPAQGAGADYHYRNESDWLWMQELAWELYRNHMVIGSIIDRAVEYQIGDGFNYDPRTGDPKLDQDLKDWWAECSIQPDECSPDVESVFVDQEETALRSVLVGGDVFAVPYSDGASDHGSMHFRESQFCRSPTWGKNNNIVHGIELEPTTRRRVNYYFTDEPLASHQAVRKSQLTATPAFYFDELTQRQERNVFHIRLPRRFQQTRGITAFAPLLIPADYHNDIEFLELVHKRSAALFAFVRQRSENFDPRYLKAELAIGPDVTDDRALDEVDAAARQYREVAPGTVLQGLPGETIDMKSPNIPNPEHFAHVKMLLTYIGINVGMPLVMVLMDASETNFSGIRGAVDMARNGFKRNQRRLISRFHMPYLRFKLLKYAERDASIRSAVVKSLRRTAKVNIFSHWWQPPSWPYIEPVKDATADLIRDTSMQISPRRRCQERGYEWSEIYRETIEDRAVAIEAAATRAQAINDKLQLQGSSAVSWRDLAPLPTPERVTVKLGDTSTDSEHTNDRSSRNDATTR